MQYNNISISLGYNCNSAQYGVINNYRLSKANGYNTTPFDLMVTNINGIIDCLTDNFKFLCDEQYLQLNYVNENESTIYNTKYNFIFNHESPGHANLHDIEKWKNGKNTYVMDNYKELKIRYKNRIDNFINYCNDKNNIITFIITNFNKQESDLTELKYVLSKNYPTCKYNFIILNEPKGKEYYIYHLRAMKFTDNDNELKRLL